MKGDIPKDNYDKMDRMPIRKELKLEQLSGSGLADKRFPF